MDMDHTEQQLQKKGPSQTKIRTLKQRDEKVVEVSQERRAKSHSTLSVVKDWTEHRRRQHASSWQGEHRALSVERLPDPPPPTIATTQQQQNPIMSSEQRRIFFRWSKGSEESNQNLTATSSDLPITSRESAVDVALRIDNRWNVSPPELQALPGCDPAQRVGEQQNDDDTATIPPVPLFLPCTHRDWDRPGAISIPGISSLSAQSHRHRHGIDSTGRHNDSCSSNSNTDLDDDDDVTRGGEGMSQQTIAERDERIIMDHDTGAGDNDNLHIVAAQLVEETSDWYELNSLRQAMARAEVAVPVPMIRCDPIEALVSDSTDREISPASNDFGNESNEKTQPTIGSNRIGWARSVCWVMALIVAVAAIVAGVLVSQPSGPKLVDPPSPAPSPTLSPAEAPSPETSGVAGSAAPSPLPFHPPNCFANTTAFKDGEELRLALTQLGSGTPDTSKYGRVREWCVSLVEDFSWLFANYGSFEDSILRWDTSSATNMQGMFFGVGFTPQVDHWNTSRVTDMSSMFENAVVFDRNLSSWDTSKVTSMRRMFHNAQAFNGDISAWDTSQVKDMEGMFFNALNFKQNLSNWTTSNVRNMNGMFNNAYNFTSNISSWDTSRVLNMSAMFYDSYAFDIDISSWNISNVQDMSGMFYGTNSFSQNLCKWGPQLSDHVQVESMFDAAFGCISESDPDLNVTPPGPFCYFCDDPIYPASCNQSLGLFRSGRQLQFALQDLGLTDIETEFGPIEHWCVGLVQDFNGVFGNMETFNVDISQWDMSKAISMGSMFYDAQMFNQDISTWNTSLVSDMSLMFYDALAFNQNLSTWDTGSVIAMADMFYHAGSFNGDISSWDTSRVVDMSGTFNNALSFNRSISMWDTSRVTRMSYMFYGDPTFNQDISAWNVSAVQDLSNMFTGASSFNRSLSTWDVSNAINLQNMFTGALSFAQNLCQWGTLLNKSAVVLGMFVNTSCPTIEDPQLNTTPPGPFCFPCD